MRRYWHKILFGISWRAHVHHAVKKMSLRERQPLGHHKHLLRCTAISPNTTSPCRPSRTHINSHLLNGHTHLWEAVPQSAYRLPILLRSPLVQCDPPRRPLQNRKFHCHNTLIARRAGIHPLLAVVAQRRQVRQLKLFRRPCPKIRVLLKMAKSS